MSRRVRGIDDESDQEDSPPPVQAKTETHDSGSGSGDDSDRDSSEEDDEDDEEELAKLRENFIADDEDEDEEGDQGDDGEPNKSGRKAHKRTRRRKEDEELDEDDLDLVREASGKRFRRLQQSSGQGLSAMFDDEEQEEQRDEDDLDDFIEHDQLSDEEERPSRPAPKRRTPVDLANQLEGLDNDKLEEIFEVFGDGEMYDWALEGEEEEQQPDEQLSLQDVFEPSELRARMLTAQDNTVRSVDIPERYQVLRENFKHGYNLSENDMAEKCQWVAEKILQEKRALIVSRPDLKEPLETAIGEVVEFIADDNLEVPFIWHHRQDFLRSGGSQLLSLDDVWRILALDIEFHSYHEKRANVQDLWKSLENDDPLFVSLFDKCASLVEYQDVMDWIQYRHAATLKERTTETKRHSRFGAYDRIRASPVWTVFVEQCGISPVNFGRNLEAGARLYEDEDPSLLPIEIAKDVNSESPEDVLSQAADILSMEFSQDPRVRRFFRQNFEQSGKIDIVLTEDGKKRIDDNSPFWGIKYACNWSFEELRARPEFYLRMHEAERQGLVIVRVQYPSYKTTLFENILGDYLSSDKINEVAKEWNEFRRRVLKATSRRVVPLVSRNIREDLRTDCLKSLRDEVRSKFAETVNQAPFKPPELDTGVVPRVLTLSPGMGMLGKDAVIAVCLDEDGILIETAKFNDPRSPEFQNELAKVVDRTLPDVIGIAGFTVSCKRVKDLVEQAVKAKNILSGETDQLIEVLWVQDEVARIYRNTPRAKAEFAELPPLAHYCVGLARFMQSPLLEYAALGDEIYSLQLHPNQHLLPRDYLKSAVDSVFVDTVNVVGIDINQAVRHESIGNIVQYISGLGPRKASSLLSAVQNKGTISSRQDLVTSELMGGRIWINCSAFFRIENGEDLEPLDATRIHPEDYTLARKMAADALELDEEDIQEYEDNTTGGVVSKLMDEDVGKLDELVLEDFAASLENQYNQRKLCTLHMIRDEIKNPYRELRAAYKQPTDGEVFTMLTGETKQTLRPDTITTGVVRKVFKSQLLLTLSCGVDAQADSGNITDDRSQSLGQMFVQGQAVQAAVVNVDYKNFFVVVNTKPSYVSETIRREHDLRQNSEPTKWNTEAETADAQAVQHRIDQEQRQTRIIKHPLFRPFTSRQAEEHLAPMQRGDLVIRPSSKGNDHITITWKVSDQIYQHVDVVELEKPNEYTIGKYLQVGRFRYSDLDELIIMHIQAMARKVDEMAQHEKFREGSKADVDKWLTAYTDARPKQSVYAFCFDHKHPGYFLLCFKTAANQPTKQWYVKTIPNGYELMGNSYPDVPSLCNGFKMIFQNMANRR